MIENPLRHGRIREAIQQKLGSRAVVVTNLQDRPYETDGAAYLGRKRDAQDITGSPICLPDTVDPRGPKAK